jgi:hypothetical protein
MRKIIIPIAGRRGSGKDTLAKMGIEKFGATASFALSDWFKRLLAHEFKIPLEDFYSSKKDERLAKPIVLKLNNIRALKSATSMMSGKTIDMRIAQISIMQWDGREIWSLRDLMIWFAEEVINNNLGKDFHNKIVEAEIDQLEEEEDRFAVVFVTDARQVEQADAFKTTHEFVYPIRITRPDGTNDSTVPEKAVDEFPDKYFFADIVNEGTLDELEVKVRRVLGRIRDDVKKRMAKDLQAKKNV